MRQSVCAYAERVAEKLREDRQFCHHISVFIRTSPSDTGQPGYDGVREIARGHAGHAQHHRGSGEIPGRDLVFAMRKLASC